MQRTSAYLQGKIDNFSFQPSHITQNCLAFCFIKPFINCLTPDMTVVQFIEVGSSDFVYLCYTYPFRLCYQLIYSHYLIKNEEYQVEIDIKDCLPSTDTLNGLTTCDVIFTLCCSLSNQPPLQTFFWLITHQYSSLVGEECVMTNEPKEVLCRRLMANLLFCLAQSTGEDSALDSVEVYNGHDFVTNFQLFHLQEIYF